MQTFKEIMAPHEKKCLEERLVMFSDNQTKVAASLGLNRGTLREKLKDHGLLNRMVLKMQKRIEDLERQLKEKG